MPNPENVKSKGFKNNPQNINKNGRPISIKNQLKELLAKNGELPIPAETFIKMIEKDGKEYYLFKIPTQDALALRLISLAMSKNTSGFNALKLLLETFDGKAMQPVESKHDFSEQMQKMLEPFKVKK